MTTKWITTKSEKKKELKKTDQVGLIKKESWIKRKPKEYDSTEATAHMKTKKKFWIKKKKKITQINK